MTNNQSHPSFYDLPHDEWRLGQFDTIQKALSLEKENVMLLQAPTGSGKTAIARALAKGNYVTSLCQTKMLQSENYETGYNFDVLFGRGNYPCHIDPSLTAAECEYMDEGMHSCPHSGDCQYLLRKDLVKNSRQRSLNYAYWFVSKWPHQVETDFLVCDEAHLLSDIVLDFAGATFTDKHRKDWDLPDFPRATGQSMLFQESAIQAVIDWLTSARTKLLAQWAWLSKQPRDPKTLKRKRAAETLGLKIRASLDALQLNSKDWYIESGPNARSVRGGTEPGLVCRPLTARYHAPKYLLDGYRTVMMSATMGDFQTFGRELGIAEYEGVAIPPVWPASSRPILVPKDAPKLGQAAKRDGPTAYEKQADIIAHLILSENPSWSGVVHCTSIKDAKTLAGRLARRGLQDRVWLPPEGVGTEEQMASWQSFKVKTPNALAVAWSWHVGVDLVDEKICIAAKVPFPFLADPYERKRLAYDGSFYLQRTSWALEQSCGRTRRGRTEDYDTPDERKGLVAIVDGNWTRCEKYLSGDFREAIVEV